jgi:hypothetical protein
MPPRKAPPTKQPIKLEGFYDVKQAAVRLGLATEDPDDIRGQRWLRDGVNHKGFPHHRMNRVLMFSDSDLAEIAAMHRNAPTRAGRPRRARVAV